MPVNFLLLGFVADLRAAKHHDQFRAQPFKIGDELGGWRGIPDGHAKADDQRLLLENLLGDVEWALVDIKFEETGARTQFAKIGEEIPETKGAMRVLRVQCSEDDVHADITKCQGASYRPQ